jgi:hypothetical protein
MPSEIRIPAAGLPPECADQTNQNSKGTLKRDEECTYARSHPANWFRFLAL